MSLKTVVLTACLLWAGSVSAQSLPRPAEFYFDADVGTAEPVVATEETGDAAVQALLRLMEREPRNAEAVAHLAHVAMQGGRETLGRELYRRAAGMVDSRDRLHRPILWNHGWDLYRLGDHDAALAQWAELVNSRGLDAIWMPHTLALALWSVDRKDEAVQWYAAAVRSEPDQWRGTGRYEELLPEWSVAERAVLAEVHDAWAADPPPYP